VTRIKNPFEALSPGQNLRCRRIFTVESSSHDTRMHLSLCPQPSASFVEALLDIEAIQTCSVMLCRCLELFWGVSATPAFRQRLSPLSNFISSSFPSASASPPPTSEDAPSCFMTPNGYSCFPKSFTITDQNASTLGTKMRAILLYRSHVFPACFCLQHHQLGCLG
jgi:hypothetical protein